MTDERELRLRFAGDCRGCGAALAAGTRAAWDRDSRTLRCLACPAPSSHPDRSPVAHAPLRVADEDHGPEWGVAGASAQREYDKRQSRRRSRLRSRWPVIVLVGLLGAMGGAVLASVVHTQTVLFMTLGAALPVLKLITTPQHIDAWRSGAEGERAVGAMLDKLHTAGVVALHDRRVPGRRTNIDHIAVSPGGVFVIDTKNVTGKVSPTRNGIRVAGRSRDPMVPAVQGQMAVVRQALDDQRL